MRPSIDGKFLAVGDERLWVRGVTYGTFAPTVDGGQFGPCDQVEADFARMAANGLNAVRTYTVPPRWLLDAAVRHGLWVMVGLPWEQHVAFLQDRAGPRSIEERVRNGVRTCAGHPAVLCYAVGNEIPASIVRWHGRRHVERFLERLCRAVKEEDPAALATYVNFPTTEYLRLPFVDFLCFNVYLEHQADLHAYLARLQILSGDKPLVLAEVGLDSRRNGLDAQARSLEWQVVTAIESGCAGAFVFAWTDEWHRGGSEIDDWDFGLTNRQRQPKPALAAVEKVFRELPLATDPQCPPVSVLVCTHNGAATLAECLQGLGRLQYPDYEVIVVDDGSTDDSAAIARAYDVSLIRTENRGLSAARNTALEAAAGEVVAYIDDDGRPDPHWLDYLVLGLRSGAHAGVGGPNLPVPGDGLVAEGVANAPGGPAHVLISDTVAEHIPGCNMAFRRDRLIAIGGFDSQFRVAGDDVDVCWRLQARGWTLGFHSTAVVWHHRRGSVRGFLRQQRGYGRAEALLERKWPEKYNTPGHLTWTGRLYGRGSTRALRRSRIYYGTWGTEPFQSAYERPAGAMLSLASTPEWYLVICALAAVSVAGTLVRPLALALPVLGTALALMVAGALRGAAQSDVSSAETWRGRATLRTLTAALFLVQPAARLTGRLAQGLAPWRRARLRGFRMPRPRSDALWFEEWSGFGDRMLTLEEALRACGAHVRRGGQFDRWELHARAGALGGIRLRAALEDHDGGTQLLRVRTWPSLSRSAWGSLAALAALATGGFVVGTWALVPATVALVSVAVFAATECGSAGAAAADALQRMRSSSPEEARITEEDS
jgi:glycosyltransferase involved in cell wall biosynthesis